MEGSPPLPDLFDDLPLGFAFDNFDAASIARYEESKIAQLLSDTHIVRNRLKIASAVENAKALLRVQKEFGSFDAYIWQFVAGRPKQNRWRLPGQIPDRTRESDAVSRDLKRRGWHDCVGTRWCCWKSRASWAGRR